MANKEHREPRQPASEEFRAELPPGVKLLRTLEGHQSFVNCLAFDPQGETLASGSDDKTVKLWEVRSGNMLRTLEGHSDGVLSVAVDPQSQMLASGSADNTVKLWGAQNGILLHTLEGHRDTVSSVALDTQGGTLASGSGDRTVKLWDARSGKLLRTLEGHQEWVWCVAFDPEGNILASGSYDNTVKLWEARSGKLLRTLESHQSLICSVAFDHEGDVLASGSYDNTVKLWAVRSGKLLRTLEGHTECVDRVVFSPNGRLLASKSRDQTIRLWNCETWETVANFREPTQVGWSNFALAFHPTLPVLAAAGSQPGTPENERCRLIHLWELDFDLLLGQGAKVAPAQRAVHHTTGKIVLVGDHSVGKSALGYRLIHGVFKEQASTHGQQFWVFPALGKRRADGAECEAILWDFAGQPDYRLVHSLFVDDADLALILFDASDLRDPLHGVGFWLKQLQSGKKRCPILLVAAQADRGTCSLTPEELQEFCRRNGIEGPITTSAATGLGLAELVERMKSLIPWEEKAATVTTTTFKRIKDYVLGLNKAESGGQTLVTPTELRRHLEATDSGWRFTDPELLTAVGHLENYGYVKRLRTSKGELRVLLQPERLNNLASSLVLEARRNSKGLGALEERRLLAGGYEFPELRDLREDDRGVLLDSAVLLFLEHNVCFREIDPLRMEPYLVFPELINLKKPLEEEQTIEDGVAYTMSGPTENVFASLVVLLGRTHTFTRTAQWHNNARYEVGDGLTCGFRQEAERDGELDFVLCFGLNVGQSVRTLFQGLFESFLARRNLTILRYEPVRCINRHLLDREVLRQRLREGKNFAFCNDCGEKLALPKMEEPIQLSRGEQAKVDSQRHAAEQRTRFEQAVFQVRAYVAAQGINPPETFISYAWGEPEHERWVEKRLAADLQKAGIAVLLDRWDNAQIGSSVGRFVERIHTSDRIVMVGTPKYLLKYQKMDSAAGYVVAAEIDQISKRLLGTEARKESVIPLLLEGEASTSLPPLVRGRVFADFREESSYFSAAFDLILNLYRLPPNHPAVADLRETLRESRSGIVPEAETKSQRFRLLQTRAQKATEHTERQAAVQELARDWSHHPDTLRILRERAREDDDGVVRRAALQELARRWTEDPQTLPILQHGIADDSSRDVREAAIQELAHGWAEMESVRNLIEVCAAHDKDEFVRRSALIECARGWPHTLSTLAALDRAASSDSISAIRTFADAKGKDVRSERSSRWIDWLNGKSDSESFEKLPEVGDGFPSIRILAVQLHNIGPFTEPGVIRFSTSSTSPARMMTLFLGDNAAGKSTLLRAIALAFLGPDLALLADDDPERYLHDQSDRGSIEMLCELYLDERESPFPTPTFRVGMEIRRGQKKFQVVETSHPEFGPLNAATRLIWLRQRKSDRFGFACGYGALRNLTKQKTQQSDIPDDVIARVSSLFRSNASLLEPDLLSRLLRTEVVRLRGGKEVRLESGVLHKLIGSHARQDGLLPDLCAAEHTQPAAVALHRVPVPVFELSDGYSSLLALAGHLLCQALGARQRIEDTATIRGFALIDEVDLHLHPAWQRRLLPDLQRIFPQLQLIVTSHSPMIAGSIPTDQIVVLRRQGTRIQILTDLPSVHGWRADQILTSLLFDLPTSRSVETEKNLEKYANLLHHHGPENPDVRILGKEISEALELEGEGVVDRVTHDLLDALLAQKFKNLDARTRQLVLAKAGLMLSDGNEKS